MINKNHFPDVSKITELEFVPADWNVKKLSEVFEFSKKPRYLKINDSDKIPFIPMELISEYGKKLKGWIIKKYNEISSGSFVNKGDLLIAKITPCFENGKQAILDDLPAEYGYATTEVWAIHPKNDMADKEYLFYYLIISSVRKNLAQKMEGTTGRQRLPRRVLENTLILFAPFPEQKKIARVLRAVHEAKEKTEEVIKAAKELKKSLMKHLFTYGPVSIEEAEKVKLKETEIGILPEDWKIYKLESLVDVKGGKRLPKGHDFSTVPTQFPYIRVIDFHNWSVNKSDLKYITSEDREIIKRYIISKNDVYISIAGTIGEVGTVSDELDGANLTENAARMIIKDISKLNKFYLVAFLSSEIGQKEIGKRTTKTSQPKLALMRIKKIPILIPSLSIQKKFVNVLLAVDKKIEAEGNKKKALEELFKTLLNNLMTGKIRVHNLDIEI